MNSAMLAKDTSMANIPYLNEDELKSLDIGASDVVSSMVNIFKKSANNQAWNAPKAVIQPGDDRYMMAALAAMDDPSLLAVKTVVLNPDNTTQNLPQINGLVTVLDSQSGLPVAILDGNWITALRTACLSATAATYLARRDANVAGFIGCGVQARSHLTAFAELFPLSQVKLYGRGEVNINLTKQLAETLALKVEVCTSPTEVLKDVDILTTSVTYSPDLKPFLRASDMKEGSFAAIADLGAPWVKDSFSHFDRLVIDDLAQEKTLPNKVANTADINGDLFGLVMAQMEGRQSNDERNAFVFRGLALGDLALTWLCIERAKERGLI